LTNVVASEHSEFKKLPDAHSAESSLTPLPLSANDLKPATPPATQKVQPASPLGINLVSVGDGYFCPTNAVKSRIQQVWKRPSAHPYSGSIEWAIDNFRDVPKKVRSAWLEKVRSSTFKKRILESGEIFCEQFFTVEGKKNTYHKIWSNIKNGAWVDEQGASNGARIASVERSGYVWNLVIPDVCNNVSYEVRKSTQLNVGPFSSASPPPVPMMDAGMYNLYIHFLDKSTIPPALLAEAQEIMLTESDETWSIENGSVSRDLGDKFRALLNEGKIKGVRQEVSAEVSYLGGGWNSVSVGPSKKFSNRTYWWLEVPREDASREGSWYGVRNISVKGCTVFYPDQNFSTKMVRTLRNPKQGSASELSQSASRKGSTGMALYTILDCPAG
jgi:hypothetical protein